MYFSHGSVHSRGVLVLIKNSLEFQIKSMRQAKLKATLNLEFYIARKKGTLAQHYRKWNIFIPVLI